MPTSDDEDTERTYSRAETAPFCSVILSGSFEKRIKVTLPDGRGGTVEGILTPQQARSLTLGLRAMASEIDDKPFFAGGWSKARVLEAIAHDYTRLKEGDGSEL